MKHTRCNSAPNKQRAGLVCLLLLLIAAVAPAAQADTRLVVRDSLGLSGLQVSCLLVGCSVQYGLGDPKGQLFLVTLPSTLDPITAIAQLSLQLGVVGVELDQTVKTAGATAGAPPSYLTDRTPTSYYSSTVWHGYLAQPANQLIRSDATHTSFNAAGSGTTVAVIDTGVDPTHPLFNGVLVSGYDFTRNTNGGSEDNDVIASPNPNNAQPGYVNQSTVALLDQSTVALLDGTPGYAAFGHGTMTASLVHLVAPQARIMPLKAFGPDGSGYDSDILRAIYYGVKYGARVLSMSFSFTTYSPELASAVNYAQKQGVVCVASAGNDGQQVSVYPAALPGVVDVASTDNSDVQSSFTNYGAPPVDLSAPGEGVMTAYPFGTYAAGWGTSFSTPLVAGAVATMLGQNGQCTAAEVPSALSNAVWISNPQLNNRRLDTYQAVQVCQ